MTPRRWKMSCRLLMGLLVISTTTVRAASTNLEWAMHVWQTAADGLPNNKVTSLAQTPDRYLWVANSSRLARFDGVQFETFSSACVFGTNWTQKIRTLLRSRNGGLWLATDHGAVAFLKDG